MIAKDIVEKFLKGKRPSPLVCYPSELEVKGPCTFYGFFHKESNCYNITSLDYPSVAQGGASPIIIGKYLGEINERPIPRDYNDCLIIGYKYAGNTEFVNVLDGMICDNEPYQLKMDIFSRNTGILESNVMMNKGAVIIGCGSVGSLVALELARAGVGKFFLIDNDILKYHNICRHQCGIQDVGKYKVLAVKERILQINPYAIVNTSRHIIQEIPLQEFDSFCNPDCIIVGCADNREGDYYADEMIAKRYNMPFLSIGCWERAFAGEIFYCLPSGMPSYKDFVVALGDSSGRSQANTHLYMGEVGSFEPGISVDIDFVTIIGVKIILDLLNRNNNDYTQRLINYLSQYTLVCNTNNPKIGGDMAEIFSYPLQVTTSIEVEYADEKV